MRRGVLRWIMVSVLVVSVALGTTGCALWNKVQTTQVTVQVSADRLLHIAAVPRVLPNGEKPAKQLTALLEEITKKAGGYTLIENVMGGWMPPGKTDIQEERNDLLLVAGPPEVNGFLKEKLHDEFQQEQPFVISVPIQSIAVVRQPAPAGETAAKKAQ